MQVTLEKNYPVSGSVEAAWAVLSDIPELASCMPGAEIVGQTGENQYKGTVKLKVGPATAAFAGEITVLEIDAGQKLLRMIGKGADKGGSSASMELTATLMTDGDPNECILAGKADVVVNGKFAQFGGRMLGSVSDMILQQFAGNFSAKAQAKQAAMPAGAGVTDTARGSVASAALADEARDASAGMQDVPPATARPAAQLKTELSLFAIVWRLIANVFTGLFGKRH